MTTQVSTWQLIYNEVVAAHDQNLAIEQDWLNAVKKTYQTIYGALLKERSMARTPNNSPLVLELGRVSEEELESEYRFVGVWHDEVRINRATVYRSVVGTISQRLQDENLKLTFHRTRNRDYRAELVIRAVL